MNLNVARRAFTLTTSTVQATTTHAADFRTFSSGYLMIGLTTITNATLTQVYKLDTTTAAQLTPLIVSAMMVHYQGDENIDALSEPARITAKGTIAALRQSPDPTTKALGDSILSLWSDPTPTDNSLVITLK